MQILVVDDCQSIRRVLCREFRQYGHLTAECESAEVARTLLPYVDAVVCDGLDFQCFAVVELAGALGKPIVLYTGYDEIAHAAAVASVPCVRKPGSVVDLMAALEGALVEVVR